MSAIPKTIWGLWCNFKEKKDGTITEDLKFFIDRIKSLHTEERGWKVNIITGWSDLLGLISGNAFLEKLLNNSYVGPAHKSDAIRYFLLKEHGGVWVDTSTFITQSFDHLLISPDTKFICYYAPATDIQEWLINPLGELYEDTSYNDRLDKWVKTNIEKSFIKIKNNFTFMPENYFICSTKGHPIVSETYNALEKFWSDNLDVITSDSEMCFVVNTYMKKLSDAIFEIDYDSFLSAVDKKIIDTFKGNKELEKYFLTKLWNCGYIFNYLQLYNSIISHINKYDRSINYITTSTEEINEPNFKHYKEGLCELNNCDNVSISLNNGPTKIENILLLSASYNRLGKWSDNRDNRLTWEHTYLGDIISAIKSKEEAEETIKDLIKKGFNQFKFGSYTRNSPIIILLKKWYSTSPSQEGGKSIKKRSRKKNKTIRKIKRRKSKNY
jgi:hypothetical protein